MLPESTHLGKYRLCPNWTLKSVFFCGLILQAATLSLAIAMLSVDGWIQVEIISQTTGDNRYGWSRTEGLLKNCYQNLPQAEGFFDTANRCYIKDFGQYAKPFNNAHQQAIAITGVTLVALGLFGSALDLVTGIHLAFIWFRAPYDSFYIRLYRLLVGFTAAGTSCLFFASMMAFHVGLRLSVQRIPYDKLVETTLNPTHSYYVAWACLGASVLAAWVILFSTCLWAMDYVNCRSLAAAFHPTCSQRASTLSMNNGVRSSVYSLNNDGVWSIQDPPTLPRYYTSTYGDGGEIHDKTAESKTETKTQKMEQEKTTTAT